MAWWSTLLRRISTRRDPDPQICLVGGGFDLQSTLDRRVVGGVRWADVTRIRTFKVDLVTTDCICLLFEFKDGKAPLQVSEEWNGFSELFEPLSVAFPSLPPNWYFEVMSPAFEAKHRVLYEAPAQSGR